MNKRVPNDSCESAFKFLVRNGCAKRRKIKGLDECDMVEIWRLKEKRSTEGCSKFKGPETRQVQERRYSNNSLEFFRIHI